MFANACVRVYVRFRIGDYAGVRNTTLAVRTVLRNAADAVLSSTMMRILHQSVGERRLVLGSLALCPDYPQIASGTLDGIFGIDAN